MNKLPYDNLDDIIFELNTDTDKDYQELIKGPLDNKTFIRNLTIGVAVIFAAPILALIIIALMPH